MFSLANKTAIVTGGASGIGLAIATQFVRAGGRVLVVDRRENGELAIDGGLTAGWTEYALVPPANVQNGRWIDDL